MHKHTLITASAFAFFATTAGAQARPTSSAVVKPSVNPSVAKTVARPLTSPTGSGSSSTSSASSTSSFMATGPYQLDLHALKKNNQSVNVSDWVVQTGVTRSGTSISIAAGDMSLTGTVTANQFHVSGPSTSGGTLTLNGSAGTSGTATGTFSSVDGGVTRTGTFTLYPGLNMGPNNVQKIQNYGDPKPTSGDGNTCGFWCQFFKWF